VSCRVVVGLDSGWSEWNVSLLLFIGFVCPSQACDLFEVNSAAVNVRRLPNSFSWEFFTKYS
jgi:hypothetical protein